MTSELRIHDAVPLSTGGVLVARGEKGVHLYSRNGRLQHEWSCPATHLTLSDDGQRAIARHCQRGTHQLLHRLELTSGNGFFWCETEFAVASPTFDGDVWYVAPDRGPEANNFIEAIDAKAPEFERIGQGKVSFTSPIRLRRHAGQLYLWTSSLGASHLHTFALPSLEHTGSHLVEVPDFERPLAGGSDAEPMHRFLQAERFVAGEIPPFTREPVYLIDSPTGNEPWGTCRLQDLKGQWRTKQFMARAVAMTGSGRWVALLVHQATSRAAVCFDLEARKLGWFHGFDDHPRDAPLDSRPVSAVSPYEGLRIEGNHLAAWNENCEVVVLELSTQRPQLRTRFVR
jgi:hypothetical protein